MTMTRRSSVCSSLGYFSSKVGLWGVWLYGFLLICLSLYATQRLPSIKDQIIKIPKLTHKGFGFGIGIGNGNGNGNSGGATITIFSAPSPPFDNSMLGARQALAVRSWLALSPGVMVVLFGQHPSILSFAAGLGSRVSVESRIDFT
ncbi:beta-arabinofuranosyltransferase RAY1 isoform X1 [Cinnamomum micranthum f. kanehirae]|uniref:Beta-arabinofuranosyltransferase RAY1 isoform X1 n=1 Tax=Cinnamomum micranthum f. kanehirae TaxID=337451 RepID=A0A3S3MNY7_9MAGN|nr:beta-arabinofuranosyltransferase RAY1 isoform X1 [Cinnamomum micranthum f. kanehirae]